MRFPATLFAAVLAAGMSVGAEITPCRADATTETAVPTATAPLPAADDAPLPGTEDEERAYAQREAASPGAQEFKGGWIVGLLLVVALVLVIILLAREL